VSQEKLMIYIGRSVNLVSLETLLHIVQLASQRDDIGINLDGVNWAKLLSNSKKRLSIPNSNDKNREFTDDITNTNIVMGQRKESIVRYQNISKYESKTPAGYNCLKICLDSEQTGDIVDK
jgi:hypothetical protein